MGKQEHLAILRLGVTTWNRWRWAHPAIRPDLSYADLREADLQEADLGGVVLADADLSGADLTNANLREADLSLAKLAGAKLHQAVFGGADLGSVDLRQTDLAGVDLCGAKLHGVNLSEANLTKTHLANADLHGALCQQANLSQVDLFGADLCGTELPDANLTGVRLVGAELQYTLLKGADLTAAQVGETLFVDVDLSQVQGLAAVVHVGRSRLDHRTLVRSVGVPAEFLRGCGVPERLIGCLVALHEEELTQGNDTVRACRCEETRELHDLEAIEYSSEHLRDLCQAFDGERFAVLFQCPDTGRLWSYSEYYDDSDERPPELVQVLMQIPADEAAARFDWSPEAAQ